MVMIGPNKNKPVEALVGTMISLVSSFSASAMGCSRPPGPVRLGPKRTWVKPIALRSHKVRYATQPIRGSNTTTILSSVQSTGQATEVHQGAVSRCRPAL